MSFFSGSIGTHKSSSLFKSCIHVLQVTWANALLQKSINLKKLRQNPSAIKEQTQSGRSPAAGHCSPEEKEGIATQASTSGVPLQGTERNGHFQGEFCLLCFGHLFFGMTCHKGVLSLHWLKGAEVAFLVGRCLKRGEANPILSLSNYSPIQSHVQMQKVFNSSYSSYSQIWNKAGW